MGVGEVSPNRTPLRVPSVRTHPESSCLVAEVRRGLPVPHTDGVPGDGETETRSSERKVLSLGGRRPGHRGTPGSGKNYPQRPGGLEPPVLVFPNHIGSPVDRVGEENVRSSEPPTEGREHHPRRPYTGVPSSPRAPGPPETPPRPRAGRRRTSSPDVRPSSLPALARPATSSV